MKYWLTFNEINCATIGDGTAPLYGLGIIDRKLLEEKDPITFDKFTQSIS